VRKRSNGRNDWKLKVFGAQNDREGCAEKGVWRGRRKGEDQIKLKFGFRMKDNRRRGRDWRRAACASLLSVESNLQLFSSRYAHS